LTLTAHNLTFPEFQSESQKALISSGILNGLQSKIYEQHQTLTMIVAVDGASTTQSSTFPSLLSPRNKTWATSMLFMVS
jgi:hypothetical protein